MKVITFYSYKGGVGRTLACANFGLYLAKTGQKVVLADMDFEAPGLDSKFPSLNPSQFRHGLLDHLHGFSQGDGQLEIHAEAIPLSNDITEAGGGLWLIPAGNYTDRAYYSKLSRLNWDMLTSSEAGLAFCLDLVRRIKEKLGADVLAIDSRTGLTEVGGLCTQVLPDTVILFTSTSQESVCGTKRIYERINKSPFVLTRFHGRDTVDTRVVVARIPRPENLSDFDELMRKRIDLDVVRLYYLFDQNDLSVEEYLALNRFAEEHPAILDDYVELFASFHPETTKPYILRRLESFRAGVTLRTLSENANLVEELVTLFPSDAVYLEAARYYRLAKGGDVKAIKYYIKYLDQVSDRNALAEFVAVCASVPANTLEPHDVIADLILSFGLENVDAGLIDWLSRVRQDQDTCRSIVQLIEADRAKLGTPAYRKSYFTCLHKLGDWSKIVEMATEKEALPAPLDLIMAEAYARLGNIPALRRRVRTIELRGSDEFLALLRILHKVFPPEWRIVKDLLGESQFPLEIFTRELRHGRHRILRRMVDKEEDSEFGDWLDSLMEQIREEQRMNQES